MASSLVSSLSKVSKSLPTAKMRLFASSVLPKHREQPAQCAKSFARSLRHLSSRRLHGLWMIVGRPRRSVTASNSPEAGINEDIIFIIGNATGCAQKAYVKHSASHLDTSTTWIECSIYVSLVDVKRKNSDYETDTSN